jgi:hypothetical protein
VDIKCEEVWREISNYLDNDVDPSHFSECRRCKSILDGMRNVVSLYQNERIFVPSGDFHRRLHGWLTDRIEGPRGSWWGWIAATGFVGAAAALILITGVGGRAQPRLRAEMSQPAIQTPQPLVAVVEAGKLFHNPHCSVIHGKFRMMTPEEAVREGYTPCARCLGADLRSAAQTPPRVEVGESQINVDTAVAAKEGN